MRKLLLALFPSLVCLLAPVSGWVLDREKAGILVLAHGGTPEWNRAVEEAVEPLRAFCPLAIAFGMAERDSLQAAVEQLERAGVSRIAAVGLFVSARSFRHQTEYLLGLHPDPPVEFLHHPLQAPGHGSHSSSGSRDRIPPPIRRLADLVLNEQGLYDSPEMGEVLVQRVRAQMLRPQAESVLVLAHGVGDDEENARWNRRLDALAEKIRRLAPFYRVRVETLREDWQEKRVRAEERIREFVRSETGEGRRVIVVPFRLFGFGPYRQVLEGLQYVTDEKGLLPHPEVTNWVRGQAEDCFERAGWRSPFEKVPALE